MLEQVTMIEKVREVCEQDERVMGALMYGSFALRLGDRFSDIEFYLFFQDRVLDEVDEEAWVAQIAPAELHYVNEFGNGTAVFENLVRGEFHSEKASDINLVDAWQSAWCLWLDLVVFLDRDGELSRRMSRLLGHPPNPDTPERALFLCRSLINWTLMGSNLLKRGEHARALAFLALVHGLLLQAARLVEGATANWLSPYRRLEEDVSVASYERFSTCTAALDAEQLVWPYRSTWEWSRELMAELSARHAFPLPDSLLTKLDRYLKGA